MLRRLAEQTNTVRTLFTLIEVAICGNEEFNKQLK